MNCRMDIWPSSWVPSFEDLQMGALYAILFVTVFVLGELGRRFLALPVELTRKFVHLAAGILVAWMPCFFSSIVTVLLLSLSFFTILVATRALGLLSSVHGVERRSSGAFVYPLSVFGMILISGGGGILYTIPILVLAFSDALAAVVGKSYGRSRFRIYDQTRSIEGSFAFFVTTFLVVHVPLLLSEQTGRLEALLIALLIAVVITGFEAISVGGWDNGLIPLTTLFALQRMLELELIDLAMRVVAIGLMGAIGLLTFRRKRLTVAGLIAALLLCYGTLALGGLGWLLPLAVYYLTYNVGVSPDQDPTPKRVSFRRGGDEDLHDVRRTFYSLLAQTTLLIAYSSWPHPALYGAYLSTLAFLFATSYGLYGDLRGRLGTPAAALGPRFVRSPRMFGYGLAGLVACTATGLVWPVPGLLEEPLLLALAPVASGLVFVAITVASARILPVYRCTTCDVRTSHPWCHGREGEQLREGWLRLDFDRGLFVFSGVVALLYLGAYATLRASLSG